jgi:hypothetical protein
MKTLRHAYIYGSATICSVLLLFSPVSRSQNTTKHDAPAQQPNASSPPLPKSSDNKNPNPPIGVGPTEGSINGNTYTNDFFQFSFSFPEGWKLLGKDAEAEQNPGTAVLLLVGSAERQTHGSRWICISAAKIPSGQGSLTAEAFLKTEASVFKQGASMEPNKGPAPVLPKRDPTEISLGGMRMARLELRGNINNNPIRSVHLAMISKGYIVLIMLSDPDGAASGVEAAQAINSLHFFGKIN